MPVQRITRKQPRGWDVKHIEEVVSPLGDHVACKMHEWKSIQNVDGIEIDGWSQIILWFHGRPVQERSTILSATVFLSFRMGKNRPASRTLGRKLVAQGGGPFAAPAVRKGTPV